MANKGACLLMVVALTMTGCSQAMNQGGDAGFAALRGQAGVVAVHYDSHPQFFVTQPRSVGRAMASGAALALFALPFGPLAPIVGGEMARAVQAGTEKAEAEAAGEQLALELALEDPVARVKEGLIARMSSGGELTHVRPVATAMDTDDLKSLKRALGSTMVLDVKTTGWGLRHYMADPKTFVVLYSVRTRLIRLDTEKVVWNANLTCAVFGDRRFGAPTLDGLKADGGRLLKASITQAAEQCVEPTLARLRGQELPRPAPRASDLDVTVGPSTLAEAEAKLFGLGGLVEGSVKFDAKFKGMDLTAQDLPTIRTLLRQATASPWGSEVQFHGIIDGARFKAKMDKGSAGRVEFGFEGLHFDDEGQARAFLAPLQERGVREVRLEGSASGQPITIRLTPTPAWYAADETARTTVDAPPTRVGSLTPSASSPRVAPGDLAWPPAGSTYILSERTSGSYGSGTLKVTVRYLGELTWQGKRVHAFSEGSLNTYVDARRRLLARVKDGTPAESFDPHLVAADWPLSVGKWWPNRYRYTDHEWSRSFDDVRYDGVVEAYGDVVTSAGTFKAFRIILAGQSSKTVLWYSSDLGLVVKMRAERFANHYRGAGVRYTELVSYDFTP